MNYWWPVNLGELAHVQQKILDELQVHHRGITRGVLITVSALAWAGDVRPRVAVPLIDRIYDESPTQLWDAVYAPFKEDTDDREGTRAAWNRYIEDMRPEEKLDPDCVPVALDGVDYARELMGNFARHEPEGPAARLEELMAKLYVVNIGYHEDSLEDPVNQERHRAWVHEVAPILDALQNVVNEVIPPETNATSA
jgi:hypothetical protein